jgi:uncharacterized membrane-anchored protein YjiN (DUF445 family)
VNDVAPTPALLAPLVPGSGSEADERRRQGLRRMKAVALSLLLLSAVVYVVTLRGDGVVIGYVNAGAGAAMVGAIADWFAVTALFRRPLGLPIPHTALIPNRKAALGLSLQEFVTDNFLSEQIVRDRMRSAQVSMRIGRWLADPLHSERVVTEGSKIVREALVRVKDEDVAALVVEAIIPRLLEESLSPVAGQLLGEVVRDGAHHGLVDLGLAELHRWLVENESSIGEMIAERAPWWTPVWLDERVGDRLQREAVSFVKDVRGDPDHRARQALDNFLLELSEDLQHDPDTIARAERLKRRVLAQPQVATTTVSLWNALRRALVESLGDADGPLRRRSVAEVTAFARRLTDEPALRDRLDGFLADAAAYLISNYGDEIATIISDTVDRWDGKEAARRIELHVGRDLQFIRINGTVVGGLAGVVIHALASLA